MRAISNSCNVNVKSTSNVMLSNVILLNISIPLVRYFDVPYGNERTIFRTQENHNSCNTTDWKMTRHPLLSALALLQEFNHKLHVRSYDVGNLYWHRSTWKGNMLVCLRHPETCNDAICSHVAFPYSHGTR